MQLITLTEGIKPDRASETETQCQEEMAGPASHPKRTGREGHFKVKQTRASFVSNWKTQKTAWDSTLSHFVFINAILLKVHVLNIDF